MYRSLLCHYYLEESIGSCTGRSSCRPGSNFQRGVLAFFGMGMEMGDTGHAFIIA